MSKDTLYIVCSSTAVPQGFDVIGNGRRALLLLVEVTLLCKGPLGATVLKTDFKVELKQGCRNVEMWGRPVCLCKEQRSLSIEEHALHALTLL